MIVLRVRLHGQTRDHRLEGGRATLGSGPRADVRYPTAGWPVLAGTLLHDGTEVRLVVPGRVGTLTLRVGDEVQIGQAQVSLVGLLPLAAPAGAAGPAAAASSAPAAPPGAPRAAAEGALFGDYGDGGALPRADQPSRADPPSPVRGAALEPPATGPAPAGAPAAPGPVDAAAGEPAPDPFRRGASFGDDLVAQLRRAPWYACSLVLHALAFVLLQLLLTTHAPPALSGADGRVAMGTTAEPQEADRGPEPEPVAPLEPMPLPEPEPLPLDEPVPAPDTQAPAENPQPGLVLPESDEEDPPLLGTLPTLSDATRRTTKRRTAPAPAPPVDVHEPIAKENVREANRRAAAHVRDQLGVDRGGPGESLRTLTERDVVVVEGEWDHHEHVLDAAGLPHRNVSPYDASLGSGQALEGARFVFWNCGDRLAPRHAARLAPRVRAFVEQGGYLFTSDWALTNIVIPAFPGFLGSRGNAAGLPELVLDIVPTPVGRTHPLLQGVFPAGVTGRWWLEQASHDIEVKRPADVTVLIEAPQLRDVLQRSPAMAVTFAYGRGRVLHLLGHYYQEQGNLAGAIAAQRLALNFVLMGLAGAK